MNKANAQEGVCSYCGNTGHAAIHCRKRPRDEARRKPENEANGPPGYGQLVHKNGKRLPNAAGVVKWGISGQGGGPGQRAGGPANRIGGAPASGALPFRRSEAKNPAKIAPGTPVLGRIARLKLQ